MSELSPLTTSTLALCRATGWELYKNRQLPQAEIVALGLVAADQKNWYHHSLLAATLQKQGRFDEAFDRVNEGLAHLPAQPELLTLKLSILEAKDRLARAALRAAARPAPSPGPKGQNWFPKLSARPTLRSLPAAPPLAATDSATACAHMLRLVTAIRSEPPPAETHQATASA